MSDYFGKENFKIMLNWFKIKYNFIAISWVWSKQKDKSAVEIKQVGCDNLKGRIQLYHVVQYIKHMTWCSRFLKEPFVRFNSGLFTFKDIQPFLCPKEETWWNPIIYHIFSCAFLSKLTATARLINEVIEGLLAGLRPTGMARIYPSSWILWYPQNRMTAQKLSAGAQPTPEIYAGTGGKPLLILWHRAH